MGFQLAVFKNKLTFMKKKQTNKQTVLHTTTLMQCKAGHVIRDLFSTNQENDSKMIFAVGATKIDLQNLKT